MMIASAMDYREAARRRLPEFLFEYIDGGSYDEVTLARNVEDLRRVALRQRVLRDVSALDLSTVVFGEPMDLPVVLAPVGLTGLYARRGEVQAARAARAHGVVQCLSAMSVCSIEEVSQAVCPPWFQLYMLRDRGFMRELLARAWTAGSRVLVFTVDLPVPGARYRDVRSGLTQGPGVAGALRRVWQLAARPAWVWDVGLKGRPHSLGNVAPVLGETSGLEDFLGWIGRNFDPRITWADLDFIRSEWKGKVVIKGILDPDDARDAVRAGADGLVVSNHGGRQLDGALSTAVALPRVVDRVGGELTILADGGVRSGLDVARMLSLGADAVMLGRAWVYALAACGEAGVDHLLGLMASELRVAMALTGVSRISDFGASCIEAGQFSGADGGPRR